MGLSLARNILNARSNASLLILDKEEHEAEHASGRNSGVLHAGFYYTADSLKAKFTVDGNQAMQDYCRENNLPLNNCGKLVVCQNEEELKTLRELEIRGNKNGSRIRLISEEEAVEIEPNVNTYKMALHSPDTTTIDPKAICLCLKNELMNNGVEFSFSTQYLKRADQTIETNKGAFTGRVIVNAGGLYADKIANDFGFGENYTMMPFKGVYLKYERNLDLSTNIYPVPNLMNPFLGVHFTKTVTGEIKIGPTAMTTLARENYHGFSGFKWGECFEILYYVINMYLRNTNHFRKLADEEWKKRQKHYLVKQALKLVNNLDPKSFTSFTKPGIRAQLINRKTFELVQDFVVEGDDKSIHILNAVSPAFTCAFPFAEFITKKYLKCD